MNANVRIFSGKLATADSTVMPTTRSWLRQTCSEHGSSFDDHHVILWLNCTTIGILGAHQRAFLLNYITNVLADYPLNGICFCIFPNRAGQEGRTLGWGIPEKLLRIVFK